ncbi:MAG: hypothetical protein C0524_04750 [Rhodobacter sp.]|nr:hypothetical protein [Rhodobacter sp.]
MDTPLQRGDRTPGSSANRPIDERVFADPGIGQASLSDAGPDLEATFERETHDPSQDLGALRSSAAAVERDALVAPLLEHEIRVAPGLTFDIQPPGSSRQMIDRLRQKAIDFALKPAGVEGEGIMQHSLLVIRDAMFFEPAHPLAEGDFDAFSSRPQVRVAFGPDAGFQVYQNLPGSTEPGRSRFRSVISTPRCD